MSTGSPVTPSSPDRSRLVPLTLDYTRLARSKTNREPVRRLIQTRKRIGERRKGVLLSGAVRLGGGLPSSETQELLVEIFSGES